MFTEDYVERHVYISKVLMFIINKFIDVAYCIVQSLAYITSSLLLRKQYYKLAAKRSGQEPGVH